MKFFLYVIIIRNKGMNKRMKESINKRIRKWKNKKKKSTKKEKRKRKKIMPVVFHLLLLLRVIIAALQQRIYKIALPIHEHFYFAAY